MQITGNYQNITYDRVANRQPPQEAEKKGYQVFLKTADMLYSGGNGTGLSFYIKYAEDSSEEEPLMLAKGADENGREFEQVIRVNDVNPQNATVVEMRALEAYLDADKGGGLSSFSKSSGAMKLNDRRDFIRMFESDIGDMNLLGLKQRAEFYSNSMRLYLEFYRSMKDK